MSVREVPVDDLSYPRTNEEPRPYADDIGFTRVAGGIIRDYLLDHFDETVERIGRDLAQQAGLVTTVFSNVSPNFIRHMIRVWHLRGPDKTEIWSYCVVDKEAPEEVKTAMRRHLTQTFGPSGNLEQDDMNNWEQCTGTARGVIARRYPQNIQANLGHEEKSGAFGGGKRLRRFYARWAMMMEAESWGEVDLETRVLLKALLAMQGNCSHAVVRGAIRSISNRSVCALTCPSWSSSSARDTRRRADYPKASCPYFLLLSGCFSAGTFATKAYWSDGNYIAVYPGRGVRQDLVLQGVAVWSSLQVYFL